MIGDGLFDFYRSLIAAGAANAIVSIVVAYAPPIELMTEYIDSCSRGTRLRHYAGYAKNGEDKS
jgi:hypothetical protein